MKIDIYQCTDGYEGTWREGLWCGRIREETHGMSVYGDTEDEVRIRIVKEWEREQKRMEDANVTSQRSILERNDG
jgi:hypothetical protein